MWLIWICLYPHYFSSVMSNSLQPHGLQHARLPCPSPSPEARSNSCLLSQWCHPTISSCCPILLPTLCDPMDYIVHGILQARILERVAVPFSRGSSHPRDQSHVSCIAGGFFTSWAIREAPILLGRWQTILNNLRLIQRLAIFLTLYSYSLLCN